MPKSKTVVLGASGFIGSHLVLGLAEKGHRVIAFDKNSSPISCRLGSNPLISECTGDFFDSVVLNELLNNCDLCINLVSTTAPEKSNEDPHFDAQTNICGTLRLLDAAVKQKVKKIIFPSSGGTVYGNSTQVPIAESHKTEPICSYGITKLAIEKYLTLYHRLHGIKTCTLRLANPYGPLQSTVATQGAIAVFLGKVLRQEEIKVWGDGTVVRDFIFIDDVVRAFIMAADSDIDCDLYNVGSATGHSINEIISTIRQVTGCKVNVTYSEARSFDVPSNVLDITKIRNKLGWHPQISLADGLTRTWSAIKASESSN